MMKIGFVGLGSMGLPMAKNLAKAGYEVKGFHFLGKEIPKTETGEGADINVVNSIAEAVKDVDVVISMVPESANSKDVYLKDNGILKHANPGTLLIDCSTIYFATSRDILNGAEEAGFQMLDAPVSGGISGAETRNLTFMVCGNEKAFLEGEPILKKLSSKIFHLGTKDDAPKKKIADDRGRIIYKKRRRWRGIAIILIFLFLGGNAILFSLIEENIKIVQGRLTVTYSLSTTEHKIFCGGSRLLGLDIDGC